MPRDGQSIETILTFDNRADAQSQWSTVWSTAHVPGMDNATGGAGNRYMASGRRNLRFGSLALSVLLTMHCRVSASALTGGVFIFMMFLVVAVMALANPVRHFEVYLGQWSINGPGRAFRIVPLFDGIGIAMGINAIVRAINCCTIAALAATYVLHSINDDELPFKYCRDWDFKPYQPELKEIRFLTLQSTRFSMMTGNLHVANQRSKSDDFMNRAWRNATRDKGWRGRQRMTAISKLKVCKETFYGPYPAPHATPPYNFFYLEVAGLHPEFSFNQFHMPLILLLIAIWFIIWLVLISERLSYGRLIWNNISPRILIVPWLWSIFLIIVAASNAKFDISLMKIYQIGAKEIVAGVADAFEVALYIHSASVGTELITGKGLNRYAAGHIDALLHGESVWHSGIVLLTSGLHSAGAALCALSDTKQLNTTGTYDMHESTLWILPMYSKCISNGGYSHTVTTWLFFGLAFSYVTVAYVLLKTALHTIFEFRIKLVFIEQYVVAGLIALCALLSLIYTTGGGIPLLESVDSLMTGVATPLICVLELVALLYVYRSHDFTSDANVAMEDSACSSRIAIQWQVIPFITLATLLTKISVLSYAEMPIFFMYLATVPLALIIAALPLRAIYNVYSYLHTRRE